MPYRIRQLIPVFALILGGLPHLATANPPLTRQLQNRFESRQRELRANYRQRKSELECAHRAVLEALDAERRAARNLCELQRKNALLHIRQRRQSEVTCHRDNLKALRYEYRVAVRELKAWYDLARRRARRSSPICPANVYGWGTSTGADSSYAFMAAASRANLNSGPGGKY